MKPKRCCIKSNPCNFKINTFAQIPKQYKASPHSQCRRSTRIFINICIKLVLHHFLTYQCFLALFFKTDPIYN